MCNATGIDFVARNLTREMVAGRDVLEVGAYDVNGSVRPSVESLGPARYLGVDITPGPRVDAVMDAGDLVANLGAESFDIVLTTEMVEHVRDWRRVFHNLKTVVRPGGILVVTTRSIGFHYHGWPYDFWRYEPEDMRDIFADFEIIAIERDPEAPGVFVVARRPQAFSERAPTCHLFSIVTGRRERSYGHVRWMVFRARTKVRAWTAARAKALRRRRPIRWRKTLRRRVVRPVWMALPMSIRQRIKGLLHRI
jgi:SAM-dependent methyltransferase